MKTIEDIDLNQKKVIIRCDFNVPIKEGRIIDDTRIKASLKTIKYAVEHNAKIILLSHLGRIKTEADTLKNDLKIVGKRLSELLNKDVKFINQTRGKLLEEAINNMQNKDIILLQNTRYEDLNGQKESNNDEELGKYWASLGDVFINDAFGTIHRAHASNVGISSHLESGIGFLVQKELIALKQLDNPKHPYIVILGGAKVADKIGVIDNLLKKADNILIGGGMAFTFLKALGYGVGQSIVDDKHLEYCKKLLTVNEDKIVLPIDIITSKELATNCDVIQKSIKEIAPDDKGLDIGEETIKLFEKYLITAQTVIWNGPMGAYEYSAFKKGTDQLLEFLVTNNIQTIIGGGDTAAAAMTNENVKDKIYHISTGGGATLEYLEGKKLPGLEVIK